MNAEQWKVILEVEDTCIRCTAFLPKLDYDMLPLDIAVINMQAQWLVQYD